MIRFKHLLPLIISVFTLTACDMSNIIGGLFPDRNSEDHPQIPSETEVQPDVQTSINDENRKEFKISFYVDNKLYLENTVKRGAYASIPIEPKKSGYSFDYWAYYGSPFNFNSPIYKDYRLDAVFKNITKYTLDFFVDGQLYYSDYVNEGEYTNIPPEPKKDGYNFLFWQDQYGGQFDFTQPIYQSYKFNAVFEKIQQSIIIHLHTSNGYLNQTEVEVKANEYYKLPIPYDTKYSFVTYMCDGKPMTNADGKALIPFNDNVSIFDYEFEAFFSNELISTAKVKEPILLNIDRPRNSNARVLYEHAISKLKKEEPLIVLNEVRKTNGKTTFIDPFDNQEKNINVICDYSNVIIEYEKKNLLLDLNLYGISNDDLQPFLKDELKKYNSKINYCTPIDYEYTILCLNMDLLSQVTLPSYPSITPDIFSNMDINEFLFKFGPELQNFESTHQLLNYGSAYTPTALSLDADYEFFTQFNILNNGGLAHSENGNTVLDFNNQNTINNIKALQNAYNNKIFTSRFIENNGTYASSWFDNQASYMHLTRSKNAPYIKKNEVFNMDVVPSFKNSNIANSVCVAVVDDNYLTNYASTIFVKALSSIEVDKTSTIPNANNNDTFNSYCHFPTKNCLTNDTDINNYISSAYTDEAHQLNKQILNVGKTLINTNQMFTFDLFLGTFHIRSMFTRLIAKLIKLGALDAEIVSELTNLEKDLTTYLNKFSSI